MASADVIADWTFETSQPTFASGTNAGPVSPEVGAGTATVVHPSSANYANKTNNGSVSGAASAYCWSSTGWNNTTSYWQMQIATTGYSGISIAYDQVSSSTGPNRFLLEYSTDGTNFTPVVTPFTDASGNYIVHPNTSTNAWSATVPNASDNYAFDLSSVAGLNDASTVYFRLLDSATASASGGTLSGGGFNFLDNVLISGTPLASDPVPEPASLALLCLSLPCLLTRRRRIA